jgi:predicted helicase
MSRLLVSQYHSEVQKIVQYGGSRKETSIRNAFERLLNDYCKPRNYLLIPELDFKTKFNTTVFPDGTVKDAIRLEHGWWESKDQYDNLDKEIEKKFEKGYPDENILFEDSQTAVLIQHGREQLRVLMKDADKLDRLLNTFVDYERSEVRDFRSAITKFKEDIPHILVALRDIINETEKTNRKFCDRRNAFLEVCRQSINPEIEIFDIHEMLIQHILTEDIFTNIFHESQFHRENNIARELSEIINTFFTGATRRNTLKSIEHYYAVIRRCSENIVNHHEKQKFLKAIYENFYKAYNPKAADRLGIVYTPNEIVKFMIESTDYLVHKHFGKLLADPGVEILDPCTGTGTYVTELIEYLPADKLEHKYKHEIHCNEMAILPYYIANLNIEYTYQQKMGKYEEFQNICLVDTLDHCSADGHQFDMFSMSMQNTARIQNQNQKPISVIIGNPPYNAWQSSFSEKNANRAYVEIDKQIKSTYIKKGTAQNQNSVYDMYTRFYRWASDRVGEGVVCFITNSSFLDSRAFGGFRKCIQDEFSHAYFLDCGGNVREISGRDGIFICEKHTIFGEAAMTGIVIGFLVKKKTTDTCRIFYSHPFNIHELRENKINYIENTPFQDIPFDHITPDQKSNWINLTDNNFDEFLLLISKATTSKKVLAVFENFSRGVETGRDEWVYDFSSKDLKEKVIFFVDKYNRSVRNGDYDSQIKWNPSLNSHAQNKKTLNFLEDLVVNAAWRPFTRKHLYGERLLNHRLTQNHYEMYGYSPALRSENQVICCTDAGTQSSFMLTATHYIPDLHLVGTAAQCLSLYRYEKNGDRIDNITDWGLTQFQTHYNDPKITKANIFHYTYAVLHHPAYRTKYEINLKREFPRLPFYPDFHQWTTWGKTLMDLHLNYETIEPHNLKRTETATKANPKAKLKADKTTGQIILDDNTELMGVPTIAWDYKLGNRSALEWILDQYKEKKPKDPTIREKFNTYKFADYKEHVIDLLQRVCTVSIQTMEIIQKMPDTVDHQKP